MADEKLQCPFCEKSYKRRDYYEAHIASKHGSEGQQEGPIAQPPAAKSTGQPKEYVCMKPCWHQGVKYNKGRTAWFTDDYPKDTKGNLIHFEELSPGAPRPAVEEGVVTVSGASE